MEHRCLLSLCYFFVLFCILCLRARTCSCYASCPLVCCAVCHQYDVCENYVGSVYVGGYSGQCESGVCVFCKLCPVCFLVVGKGPSVLL